MRRKDKAIKDHDEILHILTSNTICHLAMCRNNSPYVVALSYGYKNMHLYIHSAAEGKKITILKENPAVFFEISDSYELSGEKEACTYTLNYRCCMGKGHAEIITDPHKKEQALNIIMAQHTGKTQWQYPKDMLHRTTVIDIYINELSGKKN